MSAAPEEIVRQRVLSLMIEELAYPKGLIAVEKDLSSVSPADRGRRVDILCFTPASGGVSPLLLIECKADLWDEAAEKQALGYNEKIGAPFIALAGKEAIKTFWREKGRVASVPFLPRFPDLLAAVHGR